MSMFANLRVGTLQLTGDTSSSAGPAKLINDGAGNTLLATGSTVPTPGVAGYAKGCIFNKINAVTGVCGTYLNDGTANSCLFNAQESTFAAGAVGPAAQSAKAVVALADAAATLTAAQMVNSSVFTITPTVGRALTLDTAAGLVAAIPGYQVGTYFEFTIVCLAAFAATITTNTGLTLVGNMAVNNSSAKFGVVINSATTATVYRLSA